MRFAAAILKAFPKNHVAAALTMDGTRLREATQAIEEMKAALEGLLEPELVEAKLGHASVKEVFRISRVGAIAGCMVLDGKIVRSCQVRLIRDQKVVHTGKIETLKRFKDDTKEVAEGYECGIKIGGHDDIRKGDIIEAY